MMTKNFSAQLSNCTFSIFQLRRWSEQSLLLKIGNNNLNRLFHRRLVAPNMHLRLQRLLIRRTYARELGNLSLPRLLVQAFRIPLLRDLDRYINPHLNELDTRLFTWSLSLMQFSSEIAVCSVRADETRDGHGARVGEQFGDLGDAADVLFAVLWGEA